MAAKLISQAELSRIKGVSRMAISKVVKTSISEALVGTKIDLDHPQVQKYLKANSGTKPRSEKVTKKAKTAPTQPAIPKTKQKTATPRVKPPRQSTQPAAQDYEEMTLREIVSRFGTAHQFKDYLGAWKTLADIRLKELQLKERNGELIPKEFVRVHVFSILDGLNKRLLMDTPKTITAQVMALIKSGSDEVAVSKSVHDLISAQLTSVSKKVQRNLEGSSGRKET